MSRRQPALSLDAPDRGLAALQAWLAHEVPPSLDRWVARAVREGVPPAKRAAIGAELSAFLDAAVAWGVLASFLPFLKKRAPMEAVPVFCEAVRGPGDLLKLWRTADAAFAERVRRLARTGGGEGDEGLTQIRRALEEGGRALGGAEGMAARCVAAGLPPWWAGPLEARRARSGDAWISGFLAAQHRHPPLWLRAARPAEIPALIAELGAAGLQAEAGPIPGALRAEGRTAVDHTEAWKRGAVEIQDLGSQEAGAWIGAAPGEAVWDACAGFGGKTLQIAAMMRGKGAIHASDREERRLLGLRERALRAGFSNVRLFVWDGVAQPDFPLEVRRRGGFDRALVDAPCSGSGTWRRRPDGRVRGTPAGLAAMGAQQGALLDAVARDVRSPSGEEATGGALVYLTCSVWVEENEAVIEAFLARNPRFRLERMGLVGAPERDSDTLFAARLVRVG